jgi:hypothetical protein
LIDWLKEPSNFTQLTDAVMNGKLNKADAVRAAISKCLRLDGCFEALHGKGLVAGVQHHTFTLETGVGGSAEDYSACVLDVTYQLRNLLIHPIAGAPPLINPSTAHVFCGAAPPGPHVDNFANSPAGKEYEAYLQKMWAEKSGAGWASKLHQTVEQQFPGRTHHLVPVLAGLFGDALAITEGLHASLFQLRIKLGTFHPALAFLSDLQLCAGLCEKPVLGDKASAEAKVNYNDMHAEIWANLGFAHFFDDKFVALPWEQVAHLGVPGKAGEVVVFKLCLFGLMLDNGEARSLFGTQNCLLCTGIGPSPPTDHPAATVSCVHCGKKGGDDGAAIIFPARPRALAPNLCAHPPLYCTAQTSPPSSSTNCVWTTSSSMCLRLVVRLDFYRKASRVTTRCTIPSCYLLV